MKRLCWLWLCLCLWSACGHAAIEARDFANDAERERFQSLASELRCPKCQNQDLFDSDAPIAHDLRDVLYEQMQAGRSDEEIRTYMTDRYGEFVRYRPDWHGPAVVIWVLPVFLLVIGATLAWRQLRRAMHTGEEG